MLPLVDVIIPVYNSDKFLNKCIDSVISQTYKNIRILIINDGSTDKSLDIIKEYSYKDKRVEYINQSNKGIGATRNVALDNIRGEYFYFLDSDDYLAQNAIELMVKKATATNADIIVGERKNSSNHLLTKNLTTDVIDINDIELFYNNYVFNNQLYYTVTGKLTRTSSIADLIFDNSISFGEDLLFNLCLYTRINRIAIEKNALYYYVDNEDSVTRKKKPNRCYDQYKVCQGYYRFLVNNKIFNDYLSVYTQLLWMCIISGISLSSNEGADYPLIVEFLRFVVTDKSYSSVDKAILKKAGIAWANIEGKRFLTRTKLKLEIFLIRHKLFRIYKIFI